MIRNSLIFFAFAMVLGVGACSKRSEANSTEAPPETQANAAAVESITDPNAALAEGKRLLDENQTEAAIAMLKQAVKINPDLAEAHFELGIAYALLELQNKQSGQITESPAGSNTEGKSKTASERSFERAVDAYKKWLADNPKDDLAEYNLGRTYAKLGKDDDAEKAFRAAVKLKPDDAEYQTELGAVLVKLAKYHEAIDPLKKAVELDEQNVRAQELLEDAEAGRQRIDYAVQKNKEAANQANSNKNANSTNSSSSNSDANTLPNRNANLAPKPERTAKPSITPSKPKP